MIVDCFMGDKDASWVFLQRLKAYTPTADIPLMLYSAGRLTPQQHHHTEQQGISVLDKPFDLTDLLHLVQTLVASFRSPVG
jgi:CheY-like chemotaxis protein